MENKILEYKSKFQKYGVGIKSLKWSNYRELSFRYKELTNNLLLEGKTILDVGCGFGDIIPYISSYTNDFSYLGIDMVEEFVNIAKQKYPEFEFINGDYFLNPIKEKFDIIMTCGTLNSSFLNISDYRKKAIKIMFDNCNECTVFNMSGGLNLGCYKQNTTVNYANANEILNYCISLTKKIIFKNHYNEKDFTIYMFK